MKTREEYVELAKANFKNGYNCSQAVLMAFAEELGIDAAQAAKLAQPFGAGMGGLREVCGAVSGMFMCAGLKFGGNPDKKAHYMLIQEMAEKFKELSGGSIICRDLLGLSQSDKSCAAPRTPEYYKKRPCVELVGDAAGIFADMLLKSSV